MGDEPAVPTASIAPRGAEARAASLGELLAYVGSIIASLDAAFPDRLIVEGPDQQIRDIYTETHFVLAAVLLDLTGHPAKDYASLAEKRLLRWRALETETPFNNFANCISLALLRAHGRLETPLARLLQSICTAQSLTQAPRSAGNNIFVMKTLTDLVFRPLALGAALPKTAWAAADRLLDRYLSDEGFYFDTPRAGEQERLFPGAYCLKFLFLIGIAAQLAGDAGLRARLVRGLRALTPYFAEDGSFGYLGRSDNTTFADGLAIFCLRLGIAVDAENASTYTGLLQAAATRFLATPRTPGGWPKANRWVGGDEDAARARDSYAHPTEYAAAAAAYILLGALALPALPPPPLDAACSERAAPQISHDLKLVRLATQKAEVFIRTGGEAGPAGRRYLGPTILRASLRRRVLIGAIPIRVVGDAAVTKLRSKSIRAHALRLAELWAHGVGELDPGTVGFLPYLVGSNEYCIPATQTIQELLADRFVATYSMRRFRYRGWSIALDECAALLRKNRGRPAADPTGPAMRAEHRVRLTRSVFATDDAVIIEDRIDASAGWREFRIAVRALAGVRVAVQGMRRVSQLTGWSSDGPVDLTLYAKPADGGPIGSRMEIQFGDCEQGSSADRPEPRGARSYPGDA